MNGDLISRNTTMKMLREYAEVKFVCGQIELANGILKAVNYIENDNIPVAYDVDKVVKQIKEKSFVPGDRIGVSELKVVMSDKAVEIVKGGGLNG